MTSNTESTEKKLRPRKPVEERIAELQKKIEVKKGEIAKLELKIEDLKNPKPRVTRVSMKSVFDKAKAAGMTPEEIAKKLKLEI